MRARMPVMIGLRQNERKEWEDTAGWTLFVGPPPSGNGRGLFLAHSSRIEDVRDRIMSKSTSNFLCFLVEEYG